VGNAFEFSQRGTERPQLLSVDQPCEAVASPEPVRRNGRRADREESPFFADYQGQRQGIEHGTSTVPTVLQRQGIFTESIAGRVPVIYDPRPPPDRFARRFQATRSHGARWIPSRCP
jgi:hypothetical protein